MYNDDRTFDDIEKDFNDIEATKAWSKVYQKIGRTCMSYPYTCTEAKRIENKEFNRYRDVYPFDHTRVILKRSKTDYINANIVPVDRADKKYILTQGPLGSTVGHFWLMVWEQNSRGIVMLNKIIEKNECKCFYYWPQGTGEEFKLVLNDVKLTVEQISETENPGYFTRLFKIVDMETLEYRLVSHYHYITWPDFGVPSSPMAFLDFLLTVQKSGTLDPEAGPPVVHCSAGIGRSGTFCLVDACLSIIEKEGQKYIDIQQMVLEMRKSRMGLIQTADQLRFAYRAIIEGNKKLQQKYTMEESIYSEVVEVEEETAPLPPPRGESLGKAPARPLPAIPASASLGNMVHALVSEWSSSDEDSTAVSTQDGTKVIPPEEEDNDVTVPTESSEQTSTLRRRNTSEPPEDAPAKKRHARKSSDQWNAIRRSLFKPVTLTFGFLLVGIFIYSYVKH
ncbi:tyrosine-protein phosphatase non-receptor type 1 isoform X1 [Papilio machaon]|uniref:tyrosine-protein phosphatase non-receptor type 1 isoform X1 n=2 Tax=Papilio machaon TaxID=76193 RepID=UPI001E665AEC|nr:tyrosine-protein phosphatase non-receptor type 1 isoform X1 [Papilio machaon]